MNQVSASRYSWNQDEEFAALVNEWIGLELDPQTAALKLKLVIRQEMLARSGLAKPEIRADRATLRRSEGQATKPQVWLNRSEAAKIVGVSSKTLANWATQGTGPRVRKFGRRPLYLESDLRDWIAQDWAPE